MSTQGQSKESAPEPTRNVRDLGKSIFGHDLWPEHILPSLAYAIISIGLTWPLIRHFSTALPGTWNDVHQSVWTMWHVKEAVLGLNNLFELPLVFYPHGATLVSSVPGPVIGFVALPFWPWGVEAAYNGAVLFGFVLTAYFMYRLARAWGQSRFTAFFAGLILLVAPQHLAGMQGHFTKVFFALLPLSLLCFHHAIDLTSSRRRNCFWVIATGVSLLITALFNGLHFILVAMSLAFFGLYALVRISRDERKKLAIRLALIGGVTAILLGPLMFATVKVALDPSIPFGRNFESAQYQPDLLEFILPWSESRLLGGEAFRYLQEFGIFPNVETAVAIPWIALGLALIAVIRVRRQALAWGLFTLIFIILAFGPSLKIFGRTNFTEYGLPVILPYVLLTAMPGMDFLRTPGRLMLPALIGLAMTAGFGLDYLIARYPRRSKIIFGAALLLLLLLQWPRTWDQMELRPVPAFYQEIAADDDIYGVFDLPIAPAESHPAYMYDAFYQMYQMIHQKGIHSGYLTRTFSEHPTFPCLIPEMLEADDVLIDGEPAPCYINTMSDLSENGYRYIVIHKPSPDYDLYKPGSWGEQETQRFIDLFLSDQEPLVNDDLVTVYRVPALQDIDLKTMIRLGDNWYGMEGGADDHWRWAKSPAIIDITSVTDQEVCLEITPKFIHDPGQASNFGDSGLLTLESIDGPIQVITMRPGETNRIPITISEGSNEISLSLDAGNFQPDPAGNADRRLLSFAIDQISVQTSTSCESGP